MFRGTPVSAVADRPIAVDRDMPGFQRYAASARQDCACVNALLYGHDQERQRRRLRIPRNAEYATAAALFDNMTYASGNAARESGRIVGQHCCQLRITAEKLNRSVMVSIRPGYRMWIPSSCSSASPSAASCARSCAMIGALVLAGSLLRVCVSLCRQIS